MGIGQATTLAASLNATLSAFAPTTSNISDATVCPLPSVTAPTVPIPAGLNVPLFVMVLPLSCAWSALKVAPAATVKAVQAAPTVLPGLKLNVPSETVRSPAFQSASKPSSLY